MSKNSFTPGPWILSSDHRIVFVPTNGFGNDNVTFINSEGRSSGSLEANARLIAAAPALLEALEGLINSGLIDIGMKGPGSKAWSDSVQKAKEAIKQARP